jgi:hypothetical protein
VTSEQREIMDRATIALAEQDRIRALVRTNEQELRMLCREYDKAFGLWGSAPHHLRIVAENHGLLDRAV